jgi:hypothetical protein
MTSFSSSGAFDEQRFTLGATQLLHRMVSSGSVIAGAVLNPLNSDTKTATINTVNLL